MTVQSDETSKKQDSTADTSANDVITTSLRRKNPLGNYSSYTYNLSLYMVTPEAIAKFINTGRFQRGSTGYYIVAQSGGINPSEPRLMTNSGKLGPGQGLDYYLDDLDFEILMPGGDSTPSVGTVLNFKIIEPMGFTLFTKMAQACNALNQESEILKQAAKPNLFQQHYVLGIRFYGYDQNGNILTGKEFSQREKSGYVDAETALTDDYASFERFFPILINKATYKLDGRAVTYNVEATSLNLQAAFGAKRGLVKKNSSIVASTVGEALQSEGKSTSSSRGLMQLLNEQETDEKDAKLISEPTKYSIEWNLKEKIKDEKLSNDKDYQNQISPLPGINRTSDSNVKASANAETIPTGKQSIPIPAGTSILRAIDNIITRSEYISKALIAENDSAIETATKKNETTLELNWFTINPVVYPLKFDPKTFDWSYNITYQIQEYKIPYLRFLYKAKSSRYYGPHKEYNFFLTGQNTEVISYEQSYDNQFYIISAMSTSNEVDGTKSVGTVPVRPQATSGSSPVGGKPNKGSEINNNARANIFSVADQAMATIKILGDPDYLMQNISAAPKFTSANFKKFYGGDGFSINPYGGQIFVEIIFKLAEDYQNDGLLDVNDQIKFYSTFDATQSKIKGVVYRVIKVKSMFSKGQFIQELELILIQDSQLNLNNKPTSAQEQRSQTAVQQSQTAVPQSVPYSNEGRTRPAPKTQVNTSATTEGSAPNTPLNANYDSRKTQSSLAKSVEERLNRKFGPDSSSSVLQGSPAYIQAGSEKRFIHRERLSIAEVTYGNSRSIDTLAGPVVDDEGEVNRVQKALGQISENNYETQRLKSKSDTIDTERTTKRPTISVEGVDPKTLLLKPRGGG